MPKNNKDKIKKSVVGKKVSKKKTEVKNQRKKQILPDPLYLKALQEHLKELQLQDNYPSKISFEPWIFALNKTLAYPDSTIRSGKWCVFVNIAEHDSWWIKN
jgi:hypothetical protein